MADLSQTAANVTPVATRLNFPYKIVQFGETVADGMPSYKKSADGKYYKAIANDTLEKAASEGITISGGAANQWGLIQTGGQINIGAAGVVGTEYVVSANAAGAVAPISDLSSGNRYTRLGAISAAGILDLDIKVEPTKA